MAAREAASVVVTDIRSFGLAHSAEAAIGGMPRHRTHPSR